MTCTANCIAHYAPLARPHPPEKWFERHICPLVSESPPAECWTLLGGGWSALAQLCWTILWTILQAKLYKVLYSGLYCALWQVLKGDKTRTAVLHQNHIGQRFKSCCSCGVIRGTELHIVCDIGFQFGPQCMSVCASLHTNVCDITDKFVRHCIELHLIVLHSLHQCVRHCISMYFNGL